MSCRSDTETYLNMELLPEAEEMAKELCQHIRALGIEGYEA